MGKKLGVRGGLALLGLTAGMFVGYLLFGGADSNSGRANAGVCSQENGEGPRAGETVKPRIVLQPDANSQTRVINFGNDRDPETPEFAIKSDRPLPAGLRERLSLTADSFVRTGDATAESVTFAEPRFSELTVSNNGERVSFTVCVDPPKNLPAGQYTGLVTLDGPPGVEGTTVTITANAKDERLFIIGIVATLLFAFGVLLYKGASDRIAATPSRDPAAKAAAAQWWEACRGTLGDLGWLAPTVFAIGATAGTLYALWENNPTWGESGLGSVVALIGAGLAAVGAKAIFSPNK